MRRKISRKKNCIYYFYDSPTEDEGECLRKKSCVESESEDECICELETY